MPPIPTVPASVAGYMGTTGTCTWTYSGGVWSSDATGCSAGCRCYDSLSGTNPALAGKLTVTGANANVTGDRAFRTELTKLHQDLMTAGHPGVTPDPTSAAGVAAVSFTVPCST